MALDFTSFDTKRKLTIPEKATPERVSGLDFSAFDAERRTGVSPIRGQWVFQNPITGAVDFSKGYSGEWKPGYIPAEEAEKAERATQIPRISALPEKEKPRYGEYETSRGMVSGRLPGTQVEGPIWTQGEAPEPPKDTVFHDIARFVLPKSLELKLNLRKPTKAEEIRRWGKDVEEYYGRGEDVLGGIVTFGRGIGMLDEALGVALIQASQGMEGASVVDRGWAGRWYKDAVSDLDKFVRETQQKYREKVLVSGLPLKITDVAALPQNIAFSLVSMGTGVVAGAPIAIVPLPGARVLAWLAGTAASGAAAYDMATYQIMQQYLEFKDEEKRKTTGEGLTLQEENELKVSFHSKAAEYGLWEAVPEALSNLAFAAILTGPLTKAVGQTATAKIVAGLAGMYGEELLTETVTQMGQTKIEMGAGMREGEGINWLSGDDWIRAFKEVAPQTFLLTTIMAGAGTSATRTYNAVSKSLKKEIGTTHPLYNQLATKIKENIVSEEAKAKPVPTIAPEAQKGVIQPVLEKKGVEPIPEAKAEVEPVVKPTEKAIPEALEPLAIEARKYKSAEEFVKSGQQVFRGTMGLGEINKIPESWDVMYQPNYGNLWAETAEDAKKYSRGFSMVTGMAFQKPIGNEPFLLEGRMMKDGSVVPIKATNLDTKRIINFRIATDFYAQATKEVKPVVKPIPVGKPAGVAKSIEAKAEVEPVVKPTEKAIPEALEPLAIEARKYKSAEEFVRSIDIDNLQGVKNTISKELKASNFTEPFEIKIGGSVARGIAKPKSDVDIFVITSEKGMSFLRSPKATDLNIRLDILKNQLAKKTARPLEILYFSGKDIKPTERLLDISKSQLTDFYAQATKEVKPVVKPIPVGKPAGVAKSIEAKAVERGITEAFEGLAEYGPVVIKEQTERIGKLMETNIERAKKMATGVEPLDNNIKGAMLVKMMEDWAMENRDGAFIAELVKSPLVSETSEAGQTLRLTRERTPDSATAKIQEVKKTREEVAKKRRRGKTQAQERGKIKEGLDKKMEQGKKKISKRSWDSLIDEIAC